MAPAAQGGAPVEPCPASSYAHLHVAGAWSARSGGFEMSTWYEDYLAAWDTLEVDAVTMWFTDDCYYEDTTLNHRAEGIEQLNRFVQASFDNVPEARFDFVDGVDDGSAFAIRWVMQPMGVPGVSFGKLRDGKICEQRDYWNGRLFDVPNT